MTARSVLFGAFFIGLLAIGHAGSSILHRRILANAEAGSSATAESTGDGGSASASASATSLNGTAIAEAFSSAEIVEEAATKVEEMWIEFQKNVSKNATCEEATAAADVAVDERLEALAEVYSSAFGTVSINGTGSGCVSGESQGEAIATAYLQVIIDVVARVKFEGEDESEAFAKAYGNLVGAETARAWADALIDGCVAATNGDASLIAEQVSFSRATAAPAITAFAWVEAGAECGKEAFSLSEIEGIVSVDGDATAESESASEVVGDGDAVAEGGAEATTTEVADPKEIVDLRIAQADRCRSSYAFCCRNSPNEVCRCTGSTNEKLFRCSAEASEGTDKILWVDVDTKEECYCDK